MSILKIEQFKALTDNYIYLLRDEASGRTGIVDPSVAGPVVKALTARDWQLDFILNTHHHGDHTGGNLELKQRYHCQIVGPRADADRIPGIDIEVGEDAAFDLGAARAQVFDIPGHTRGHIAFWFGDSSALFCGDTLFSIGCGRLFEGTAAQMWNSLQKLRALPPQTRVFCAHEYTESNIRFALSIDPENKFLVNKASQVRAQRAKGEPTVPSLLREEILANPFLRADRPELAEAVGCAGRDPVAVFAEIRQRKDHFS